MATRSRRTTTKLTDAHAPTRERTGAPETDRKINIGCGEDELIRTRDAPEAEVTLCQPGHVSKPPGIYVEVFIRLPSKGMGGAGGGIL